MVVMQFADIQGSLDPAPSASKLATASKAVSEAPSSPTLSPDPSQGQIQGEASQGGLNQPSASGKIHNTTTTLLYVSASLLLPSQIRFPSRASQDLRLITKEPPRATAFSSP